MLTAHGRSAARRAQHTLSVLLAFLLSIGSTPVRGTYAFFNNTQSLTTNVFTTTTLAAPTNVASALSGSTAVAVSWDASTSEGTAGFVTGYDVDRVDMTADPSGTAFSTVASIASTGAASYSVVNVPPSASTYRYRVRARAGTTGGWVSAYATNAADVVFAGAAPSVVPPTNPADGVLNHPTNGAVFVTFSEAMGQAATAAAFQLRKCSDNTCGTIVNTRTSSDGGTASWPATNVLRFQPATGGSFLSADLDASTYYQVYIGTGAQDLNGTAIASAWSSTIFQTDAGTDSSAPAAVTISSPSADTWTQSTSYSLVGTSPEANAKLQVYQDSSPYGTSIGIEDTLVTEHQLTGGLSDFSISVSLASGANRYAVRAVDAAGNLGTATFFPVIYKGETKTVPQTVVLSPGDTTILVTAANNGDANANGTVTVEWGLNGGALSNSSGSQSLTSSPFTYTISTGLSANTAYDVRVTFADSDGVDTSVAANPQTLTTTTLTGTLTNTISSVSASPESFASRASQSTTITVKTVSPTINRVNVTINAPVSRDLGCVTPSTVGAVGTATFTWNGKNAADTSFETDGLYSYTVTAYSGTSCSGANQQLQRTVRVSNVTSISISPAPATTTLSAANEYVCLTATARTSTGSLAPDGAAISFSETHTGGGSYTLTGATQIGSAATGCPTISSGTGQASAKLLVTTPAAGTITVTATMTGSSGSITGRTTVNDPPVAPSALVLTPGSIRVSFQASGSATTAGYYVHLGLAPGKYDRRIDISNTTSATIKDVIPGQRYWVAVQAYDKLGQTSPMSGEATLIAPPHSAPATITLEATSRTPGAPLRLGAIVRARVLDQDGAPAGGAQVTFSAPAGTTLESTSAVTDVNGEAATALTIADSSLTVARIGASAGSASGSIDLALQPSTPTAAATTASLASPSATPTPAATATAVAAPGSGSGAAAAGASATPTPAAGSSPSPAVGGTPPSGSASATPTPGPQASATSAGTASVPAPGSPTAAGTPGSSPAQSPTAGTGAAGTPVATQSSTGAEPAATATPAPPTTVPATAVPPTATSAPATAVPPTSVPPTSVPPTAVPPTAGPPTAVPPTAVPPTAVPATAAPATSVPASSGAPTTVPR